MLLLSRGEAQPSIREKIWTTVCPGSLCAPCEKAYGNKIKNALRFIAVILFYYSILCKLKRVKKQQLSLEFWTQCDRPNTKKAVPIVHCSSFVVRGGVKSKLLTWYAAEDGRAGGKSSHNRNSDKVWSLSESAGAALDTKHWQKTWSSEDTYVVWPPCGTWNESASLTCWRRWVDILYTCTEKTDKSQASATFTGKRSSWWFCATDSSQKTTFILHKEKIYWVVKCYICYKGFY